MLGTFACGAQRAESQHPAAAAVAFNDSVAGGPGSGGINAKHAKGISICWRGLRHGTECTATQRAQPQFFQRCVFRSTDFSGCEFYTRET
jgi:hypothetical protein